MLMPARLKSILDRQHISYSAKHHAPAYGAQYAASAMHVCGKEVAKTVVLRAETGTIARDGEDLLLAVLPASFRINLEKLSRIVRASVTLVDEDECNTLFPDCEGGVFLAFGELYDLPVYLDEALAADPCIILSAGVRSESVRLSSEDFVRLVKPVVCSFAETSRTESGKAKDWQNELEAV
jgi:Ala-tRNA(Pro) deacylase